jgi:RNA polymerase sigma-70 factor (ECF subfamily)
MENSVMSIARSEAQLGACGSQECSEAKLVQAAKQGQATAFGALCDRYARQLLRAAHRITQSHEDAEDAVQDALLRAFVHFADFDGRSTFATWLTRIAINSALMIIRKKRRAVEVSLERTNDTEDSRWTYEIADHAPNPEGRYAKKEEHRLLRKAIQNLRPNLRELVNIQRLHDGSMQQTAEIMGISVSAAKARLFHAKAALRRSSVLKLMRRPRAANPISVLSAA